MTNILPEILVESSLSYGLTPDQLCTIPVADRKSTRKSLWSLMGQYPTRLQLAVSAVASVLTGITQLAPAYCYGILINHLTVGADSKILTIVVGILIVLACIRGVSIFTANCAGFLAASSLLARIREKFIYRVLHLNSTTVECIGTGDLMTRSNSDTEKISEATMMMFTQVVESVIIIAVAVIATICTAPALTLCLFLGALSYVPTIRWYLHRCHQAYANEAFIDSLTAQSLAVTIQGAKTIDTYCLGDARRAETAAIMHYNFLATQRTLALRMRLSAGIELALFLPIVGDIVCGSWLFSHHMVSVGAILTVGIYLIKLVHPIEIILYWIDQIQIAYASYSRIEGIAHLVPSCDRDSSSNLVYSTQLPDPPQKVATPTADPLVATGEIVVHNVSFSYPQSSHEVLVGINCRIAPGSTVVIVGKSGAGKSTLARLLAGLNQPSSGSITISGVNLRTVTAAQMRHYVLLVTQEHHVFIGSIADNVRIACEHVTDEKILAAFSVLGATWVAEMGLETRIGSGNYELNALQAQQIALARVIVADPDIVILDEATSLLDPLTARASEQALRQALAGRTVIAVAHRLYSAQVADQIIVIDQRKIIESGTYSQLISRDGTFARLWDSWMMR